MIGFIHPSDHENRLISIFRHQGSINLLKNDFPLSNFDTNLMMVNLFTTYNFGMVSSESSFSNDIKRYNQLVPMYLSVIYILVTQLKFTEKQSDASFHYGGYLKIDGLEDLPRYVVILLMKYD